jgi:DNA-binding LytR/AlgR family response regulator
MATDRMPAGRTTAVIADDEPRLAEYLKARLAALWPELVVAGMAANGPDALALLAREAPDIAFLDIRMPGLTGLEVARRAGAGVHVVFVTAFDQYAVDAFEHAAADYLLKPVSDERLAETVDRLKARVQAAAPMPDWRAALAAIERLSPLAPAPERLAWIRASAGQQVRLIAVEDVVYFQANDKYTSVFTADGEALIRTPMKELSEQLDPRRFWQVHRGTIVNVAHIATTTRELSGRITLTLKGRPDKLAVSRAYVHLFKQM